jgi:hypothetical protein
MFHPYKSAGLMWMRELKVDFSWVFGSSVFQPGQSEFSDGVQQRRGLQGEGHR